MSKPIKKPISECHTLAPLDSSHLATRTVPNRVRIAPWGDVESTRGRFTVDDESARLVVAAFEKHATDLPVDYEHQTLGGSYASPSGQAPAAGWIKRLEAVPGEGLFAHIEWTGDALEQLANKHYRYLSPVALVRKEDRKLIGLHSVALTNKPAIVGAEPIVNRSDASATLVTLRDRLSLAPDSDADTVLLAAGRRIEAIECDRVRREADGKVDAAVRAGKVTEAQRDFAARLALRDADLFDDWLETAPVVVPLGRTVPPNGTTPSDGLARRAASEFRESPLLASLTSEEAFVADAQRRNGHDRSGG